MLKEFRKNFFQRIIPQEDVKKDIEIIKEVLKANEFTYSIVNASKKEGYYFYQTTIFDLLV